MSAALALLPSILAMVAGGGSWTTRGWLETTVGVVAPTPNAREPVVNRTRPTAAAAAPPAPRSAQQLLDTKDTKDTKEILDTEEILEKLTKTRRKLTKQQVVNLLNAIPTFNIVTEDEQMVTSLDANGKESICWYLDPNEAMSALMTMQAIHASTTLHLAVTSLGTAYALSEGWVASLSKVPLRVQGSQQVVRAVADSLGADTLAEHNKASGCGVVPIFSSDDLTSSRLMPLFLHPRDFVATWVSAGLPPERVPAELNVAPLKKIVNLMLTGSSGREWRTAVFVASEQSALVAIKCHKMAQGRAKKRTLRQMMRAAGLSEEEEEEEHDEDDDDDDDWDDWDDDDDDDAPWDDDDDHRRSFK